MPGKLQKILLFPFSILYGSVTGIRNWLFDNGILKSTGFDIPVISVGNITVGGTGKTPHVEYLVRLLKDNYKLAVLSRGYKRKTRDFNIVKVDSPVSSSGDEALQVKCKFPGIMVAVDRKRVHGVKEILRHDPGINMIILDDAYQHRYIKAGLSILLIDYKRPISKDCLLPAGRLREAGSSVKRADIVLVTKSPARQGPGEMKEAIKEIPLSSAQQVFFTGLSYDEPVNIFTGEHTGIKMEQIAYSLQNLLLVSGIADPGPLVSYLNGYNVNIQHLKYPDHHPYNEEDGRLIREKYLSLPAGKRCLITTEKDALRLREILGEEDFPDDKLFYLRINVVLGDEDRSKFDKLILDYAGKNRRNGSLS
ncbi:MAG: tetraacyldisaccharide 4'-kinase [Bacteroidales bacterium]|nr:tetraacyldisaccharide 4'-kinase [Bacteroidales bacterium]